MKRIISVFLVALMCLGMMTTFASAGEFDWRNYKPNGHYFYHQKQNHYKWYSNVDVTVPWGNTNDLCYLTSIAMVLSDYGHDIATPWDIYIANNKSAYISSWARLIAKLNIEHKRVELSHMNNAEKKAEIINALKTNPHGVLVQVPNHMVVARKVVDGEVLFDDPVYGCCLPIDKIWNGGSWNAVNAYREIYPKHTHNYKDDVANEKCNCGATMVRQYEDAHGEYTVIKKTSIKSKPYASYGERQIRLKVGDKVTVKRKFKNVYGNTWCEVSFGKYSGYAYLGDLKKIEAQNADSTLNINVTQCPTTINEGESFGLRGEVTSNYTISSVKGYIINSNGDIVQSTTDTPKSKRMDIRPASLNQNLLFNKLSSGKYTLKIVAKDSSGKSKTWDEAFVVKGEEKTAETSSPAPAYTPALPSYTEPVVAPLATTHKEEKPAVVHSSISIILDTFPKGNLPYGKPFTLSGKFTSDCAIVEARAYMLDANKNVIMEAKGSSTTSNYYIKGYALDNGMKFNKLSPGGYYLKYYVKDANGDTATWISDKFYIVK